MPRPTPIHAADQDHDALSRLRRATRDLHAAVDAALPGGLASRVNLVRYLRGMHGLASWLESIPPTLLPPGNSTWRDPRRARLARADLHALGHTARDPLPPPPTPREWMGGCYVMEGSALGGRVLLRQAEALASRDCEVARSLHFLRHHTQDPARWPRLLAVLRALPKADGREAISGARAAFSLTLRLLTPLSSAPAEKE